MILYTIIHPDYINNAPGAQGCSSEDVGRITTVEMKNFKLEVIPVRQGLYRINRIISTNPYAYFNPHLQPGKEIKLD